MTKIHYIDNPAGPTLGYVEQSGVRILEVDGRYFKDLDKDGRLTPYEDWRLPAEERAKDLASRMTVEQIAGLMLYNAHQAIPASLGFMPGTYAGKPFAESGAARDDLTDQQAEFLAKDHLRHVLVTSIESTEVAAWWNNKLQAFLEGICLGIPSNNSSDPRHGPVADTEYNAGAGGGISMWPESLGLAASFDPALVRRFGEIAAREYRSLGLTTALSPQIDIATDPRWSRFQGTFGEDSKLTTELARAYIDGFQTSSGEAEIAEGWGYDSVNAMVKHWPGGGAGCAFRLWKNGYEGVVCTDWGITADEPNPITKLFPGGRCWGVEDGYTEAERQYKLLMAGVDQFGGNNRTEPLLEAYRLGAERHGEAFMRARFEQSAVRLLKNMFRLGLFENPYVDAEHSMRTVGCPDFMREGYEAQLKSAVLLKNEGGALPQPRGKTVYGPQRFTASTVNWFGQRTPEFMELTGHDGEPLSVSSIFETAERLLQNDRLVELARR